MAETAVAEGIGDPAFRHQLGKFLFTQMRGNSALAAVTSAVVAVPTELSYVRTLHGMLSNLRIKTYDPNYRRALHLCLERPELPVGNVASNFASIYRQDPNYSPLWSFLAAPANAGIDASRVAPLLCDKYFLHVLAEAKIPDPDFEALLTRLRRLLLEAIIDATKLPEALLALRPFLYGLAQQCFFNEYVYSVDSNEAVAVSALFAKVDSASEAHLRGMTDAVAMLACYASIWRLRNAKAIAIACYDVGNPGLSALICRQIDEPLYEDSVKALIPALGAVENSVSQAVQAQYEANPYPRWATAGYPEPVSLRDRVAKAVPTLRAVADEIPEQPEILVAGCGTGKQPIGTALKHLTSKVLAVDLSRTSLAYALRKAEEMRIANIRFLQADILALEKLPNRFDLIECAGVLHHMAEPVRGLKVLAGLLKPNGLMNLGLYSERARSLIVTARRAIADMRFPADIEGIRAFRSWALALPDNHPVKPITRILDFYTMSECRDLVFHEQEHRFTPRGLSHILADAGLDFLGYESVQRHIWAAYTAAFPSDPAGVSLDNWEIFENRHPDAFISMYQFWARRSLVSA